MDFWFDTWERNHFKESIEEMTWNTMNKRYGPDNMSRAIRNGWVTLHEEREIVSFPINGRMVLKLKFASELMKRYRLKRPAFNVDQIRELSCM
jgi:phosphoheptose isomerase